MRMYLVRGITPGLSEKILVSNKKRAKVVTQLVKLGEVSIKIIDKKPKLRIAVGSENEILDALEWKDVDLRKWHSSFTIDPMLYKNSVKEILKASK